METVEQFLSHLRSLDIRIEAKGDSLKYSAPQGVVTPAVLAGMRQRKADILAFLHTAASAAAALPLTRRPELNGTAPASFAQERLWFLHRLGLAGTSYNVPLNLRLQGRVDEDALERSLNEILRRHETLRTGFRDDGGAPVQVIHPFRPLTIEKIDLSGPDAEACVRALAAEESRCEFDLVRGPLIRATLVRLGERQRLLLLTLHHVAVDGWSLGILTRELGDLYRSYVSGGQSPLRELPIRYADYAVWQREWLCGESLGSQLDYWKNRLRRLPRLQLPADRPRPPVETFRGDGRAFRIDAAVTARLTELSAKHGATMFMMLLAAFKVLLYRYTGMTGIAVGSPVANRGRTELEPLIGFFVNSLVLYTDLAGDPSFTEALQRVRETALGAFAHQDVPFEKIVAELQPERNLSANPLFQVSFALQQKGSLEPNFGVPGLEVRLLEYGEPSVRFDLELHMWHEGPELHGLCSWNTDLFDAARIERMLGHYRTLLAAVAANPAQRIGGLPLLTSAERQALLYDRNDTAVTAPFESVIEMIARWAQRSPEALAIESEAGAVKYEQLWDEVLRISRALAARGIGLEDRVAFCMERSFETVAVMLAILHAGAAFVPLDPETPAERLQFIAQDCGARIVIATDAMRQAFGSKANVVTAAELGGVDPTVASPRVGPQNLAYVMYTSGSTGKPKGVMIDHRGLSNYVGWAKGVYAGSGTNGAPVFSSLAFDLTITSVFVPLAMGERVALGPAGQKFETVVEWLRGRRNFTLIKLTPAHLQMLGEVLLPEEIARLTRTLVIGGEALYGARLRPWCDGNSTIRFINEYGPTETVVGCAFYDIPADAPDGAVPIGGPIANTQLYILDGNLEPLPVDVPGELYVAGRGVARGYLNRPELTAEKFVPNPFGGAPGSRMYHTGDMARWNAQGVIEFLGRGDRQIKLRGYRIELDEIEAVLREHPRVRDAAVSLRDDSLSAWVTPREAPHDAEDPTLASAHIEGWGALFDDRIYGRAGEAGKDPLFNTKGWISTFDGEPIPVAELREWADEIVDQILAEKPRRILEIGCGTGMFLFRLAPHCERYHGTDISQVAVDYVKRQINAHAGQFANVTVARGAAHDLDALEPESFDAVLINSVIQYFPGIEYLRNVLGGALRLLRSGGVIFAGDVRNRSLLEHYHATFLAARGELGNVAARIAKETELCVEPAFFPALRTCYPEISHVQVRPEGGRFRNELNRFRYHALLHKKRPSKPRTAPLRADGASMSIEEIRRYLASRPAKSICLTGMRNARLTDSAAEIEIEDLRDAAAAAGYQIEIGLSPESAIALDALFFTSEVSGEEPMMTPLAANPAVVGDWASYANRPADARACADIGLELKSYLAERVPEYMVPTAIVTLDSLPLTVNGKVDHAALVTWTQTGAQRSREPMAARSEVEKMLAGIFAEILHLEVVGIHDSFFDLGGHSLLAARLVARVREEHGTMLPLATVFTSPTVSALAAWIEENHAASVQSRAIPPEIIAMQPAGRKRPFFCVPPAAGSPLCYLSLMGGLDAEQPFYGFEAPGLAAGRKPLCSITELAACFVGAMRAVQPEGPYLLGGWSFGGPVAFEMARQLEATDEPAGLLVIFDSGLIEMPAWLRKAKFFILPFALVGVLALLAKLPFPRTYSELRFLAQSIGLSLPPSKQDFFGRKGKVRRDFIRDLLWSIGRSLRVALASTLAGIAYAPQRIRGSAVLFRAEGHKSDDPLIRGLHLQTQGGVEEIQARGNHMTLMLDLACARHTAGLLQEHLNRIQNAHNTAPKGDAH